MKVGIALPQAYSHLAQSIAELKAFAARAEEVGFDSLWVEEQLMGRGESFEPLVTLAFAAAHTERVRLCSATFIAPVRNPIVFAKQLASVDQFSNGRLTVGISVGDMRSLYPASGISASSRGARFDEMVDLIRRLWTEAIVTFHGRFFDLDHVSMEPKPVQKPHPPIWFGGHSEAALARAVRSGSGWIGAGGRSIDEFGEAVSRLRRLQADSGRAALHVCKKIYTSIAPNRDVAFAKLREWFEVHWGALARGGELASTVAVFGTPDDCLEQVLKLSRLGADEVVFNPVFDERRHLETIASEVMPVLRNLVVGDGPLDPRVRGQSL